MEARELYKQKYEAQLKEWGAKLVGLKAQADKLTAQAKLDVLPHVDAAHAKLEAVKARVGDIASTTEDKWDAVVGELDHAWVDMKASAEGAYDAMKRHKKHAN
ncbi:MAG TPA: hypothetical protein VGM56_19850 [Byssovorax sp.]|jgi:hypothetical protein